MSNNGGDITHLGLPVTSIYTSVAKKSLEDNLVYSVSGVPFTHGNSNVKLRDRLAL